MMHAEVLPLLRKIKKLHETIWEDKCDGVAVNEFLGQFDSHTDPKQDEQLQVAYLLSKFIFFGRREIRELLRSLYRDLYKYPLIADIRMANSRTRDPTVIEPEFQRRQRKTRFIGIGNPSESGVHLLYYFRQENRLGKKLFINAYEIWPAPGSEDTELGVLMEPEVGHGETEIYAGVQA